MKKQGIDLRDTHQFSTFFLDYLEGKEELTPFYSHLPEMEAFAEVIKEKKFTKENREVLCQALKEQYEGVALSESNQANLDKLSAEQTYTVTTGHQLNLFTGPLYFIYKIVSTINLAAQLKSRYPENDFVPVYWMATEDHDFDEINFFKLDGKKYQWNSNQTGAVGDFELDDTFKEFLKEVSFASDVFLNSYKSSKTLTEAVRKYVNELFGEYGLLIVDGHDSALKSEFKSVITEDLFGHQPFKEATKSTEKLESLGYKGQIFPREINLFYLTGGIRERIETSPSGGFKVVNTDLTFSVDEMKVLIDKHPERFSPNVVLRPVYQEMILPNIAYLGGPAEVIYWLQLKGVFDVLKIPFPMVLPRSFGLILDEKTIRKMEQLGWDEQDLFHDPNAWKRNFVKDNASVDLSLSKEKEVLSSLFDEKGRDAAELEKSLRDAFEAGKVRSLKILNQMSRKLRKAEERRQKITLDRVDAIHSFTHPGGSPQERVVNMMQFYLSDPEIITKLMGVFDPLDFKMWVLSLDGD